mgnify:FL=1
MNVKAIVPIVIGAILAVLGVGLTLGGGKLISLGGSGYYLLAGLLMLASGVCLVRRKVVAAWLALALLLITAVWALSLIHI